MSAAMTAVIVPIQAMTQSASDEAWNRKLTRTSMNTPAATIVAAWIRAEIGVGPSIASGNQTWSGNCADFPTAPQKTSSATVVRNAGFAESFAIEAAMSVKTTLRVALQIIRIPSMNPKSPRRFVMNALFAAFAAALRSYQWPISRYEQTPTSSQKMNIITKLFARTMPIIANMKRESDAK